MVTIKSKIFTLLFLLAVLAILLFIWLGRSGSIQQEVTIIEKYYSADGSGKVTGVKTQEVENVNAKADGPTCAMKFSNDRILVVDCERYLDFEIGEKAFIQFDDGTITEIRAKE
ncbi:hypothetical protein [Peribacillus glennii]|uniref:Uncharacterized protein n=1 Tax=Peribacillus glennii TaxID=2303991 RepID=A0A372L7V8_9BACI|nr:hypothetical protein [Peribacillus glennii]RFU60877.1 hypothetical protein D0466_20060 [Peribacillus glennii]